MPLQDQNPVDTSFNTTTSNVNVISHLGVFEVTVCNQRLDIGTVIKAKGTISEFRGHKQLDLKRVWIVGSTNEEARAWAETAAFKQTILSRPWRISSAENQRIRSAIKAEKKHEEEYARRKKEHYAKKEEQRKAKEAHTAQREVRAESRRRREEVMMNAGALA